MTAVTLTVPARRGGPGRFLADLLTVAGRSLRGASREIGTLIPALIVPLFFFAVNVGSLEKVASAAGMGDYLAFQLPVAVIFAVTGVSRASALVTDIASGYFERLLLTPVNRLALLLGLMASDFVLVVALCIPVLIMGAVLGVSFVTGIAGIVVFVLVAAAWGVAFTGFPYAIALRTGNPGAVAASFILFFPFAFLTTAYVPKEALGGWLATVADVNPVTYILGGLRSLVSTGWDAGAIAGAVIATLVVGTISIGLALAALRRRVRVP
ncbi:MAG TPA: ABC transporter permease [Candidatus Limnocylindrales bacterium]|nr:ABC transporter permease [Candidatus Limnocylindrales bacterium]